MRRHRVAARVHLGRTTSGNSNLFPGTYRWHARGANHKASDRRISYLGDLTESVCPGPSRLRGTLVWCQGTIRKVAGQTGPEATCAAVIACSPPVRDGGCRETTAKGRRRRLPPRRGAAPMPDAASRPPRLAARTAHAAVGLRTNDGSPAAAPPAGPRRTTTAAPADDHAW